MNPSGNSKLCPFCRINKIIIILIVTLKLLSKTCLSKTLFIMAYPRKTFRMFIVFYFLKGKEYHFMRV